MLVFTLLISVHVASARFLVSMPVLKVLFGNNVGSMDDLMLPPQSRRADFDTEVHGNHEELPDFHDFLREIEDMQQWSLKLNSSDLDLKDLNDASKDLINLKRDLETVAKDNTTRRQNDLPNLPHEVQKLWNDPRGLREWYYQKLCLTFLIHIRFQVDAAIRQKMAVNSFPGYRIGYLFNRMFRLRIQMTRIREEWESMTVPHLIQNRPNWRTKKHSLQMMLQLYERVLQLDVDTKSETSQPYSSVSILPSDYQTNGTPASIYGINVLVCGAFPPRGQIHDPDVMHQIVNLGLFPDKPRNMTFLEYFQQFTDVNESLAKVLQRIEFNVLDIENLDNVIKLAEDVKRLKEIKMAALDAERATRDENTLDNPQNARRASKWYPGVGWGVSNDVFHLKKFPTAWTLETKQKLIQFMQHSVYSTRYEINKLRSLRKRYENSTVFNMGKIYGNQMQLGTTAALVFGTMMRMPINQITMLWYVYHYTKLMNLAQDVVSNTEHMYLLSQRIKEGYNHLNWYRGMYPPYTSMPTDSAEATSLNPDDLYNKKKKKK